MEKAARRERGGDKAKTMSKKELSEAAQEVFPSLGGLDRPSTGLFWRPSCAAAAGVSSLKTGGAGAGGADDDALPPSCKVTDRGGRTNGIGGRENE